MEEGEIRETLVETLEREVEALTRRIQEANKQREEELKEQLTQRSWERYQEYSMEIDPRRTTS